VLVPCLARCDKGDGASVEAPLPQRPPRWEATWREEPCEGGEMYWEEELPQDAGGGGLTAGEDTAVTPAPTTTTETPTMEASGEGGCPNNN